MPPEDPQPKPQPRTATAPTAPIFASYEQIPKVVLRVRNAGIDVSEALLARVGEKPPAATAQTDPDALVAWLSTLEASLIELQATLDEQLQELTCKQTEVDVNELKQVLIIKPEATIKQEMGLLKGTRFTQEKADWKRRLDENIASLRNTQERQVAKFEFETEPMPGGRLRLRPRADWWDAYVRWQQSVAAQLRDHVRSLLKSRWQRFVDREVLTVIGPIDAQFSIELPAIAVERVPLFTTMRLASDPVHYRDPGGDLAAALSPLAPDEVIDPTSEIDKARKAETQSFQDAGTVASAVPYLGGLVKAVGMFAGRSAVKKVTEAILEEVKKKGIEKLQTRLREEFRKRLERYRSELEGVVRDYALLVQERLFDQLQTFVNAEMQRRNQVVFPEKKKAMLKQQNEFKQRIQTITQLRGVLESPILVDLELRRNALQEQIQRSAGTSSDARGGEAPR